MEEPLVDLEIVVVDGTDRLFDGTIHHLYEAMLGRITEEGEDLLRANAAASVTGHWPRPTPGAMVEHVGSDGPVEAGPVISSAIGVRPVEEARARPYASFFEEDPADYALFKDQGTEPYGPQSARYMRFESPDGGILYRKSVKGQEGAHFLAKTYEEIVSGVVPSQIDALAASYIYSPSNRMTQEQEHPIEEGYMSTTDIADTHQSGIVPDAFEAFDAEPETQADDIPQPSSTDELDDIERQVHERVWNFKGTIRGVVRGQEREEVFERTYVQKPLSYLAMMQFTSLLGRSIDAAMSGPEGLSMENLGDIMSVTDSESILDGGFSLARSDFEGIDTFVRGFAKLAAYVPDIIAEAQCIWLRVPLRDRMALVEVWSKPVDEGGLSGDEGEEMLRIFLDQNYEELEAFLAKRLRRVARVVRNSRERIHPHLKAERLQREQEAREALEKARQEAQEQGDG